MRYFMTAVLTGLLTVLPIDASADNSDVPPSRSQVNPLTDAVGSAKSAVATLTTLSTSVTQKIGTMVTKVAAPTRNLPKSRRWPNQTVSVQLVDESTTSEELVLESPEKLSELYSFPAAAHYAWLSFGREGEPIPRDALTIYEGMKISANNAGNYEVCYQVEAPLAEITLRMQLHFQTQDGRTGTLTLAPVHIHAQPEEDANVTSQSFQIVQRGHSVALGLSHGQLKLQFKDDATPPMPPFSRTGTARFGAVPQK